MITEVKAWGLQPAWVTGDSWYSGIENLKFLRNQEVGFLFGIADNRQVSVERGTQVQVKTLTIPLTGIVVYLKEFGWVKLFCQSFKHEVRYYIVFLPNETALRQLELFILVIRQFILENLALPCQP